MAVTKKRSAPRRVVRSDTPVRALCCARMIDPPPGWQHLVCGLAPGHGGRVHAAYTTGGREHGDQLAAWAVAT